MDPLVMVIGLFSLVVLGVLAAGLQGAGETGKKNVPEEKPPVPQGNGKPCPLCGARLERGERVHSVVYKKSAEDQSMEIFGCPYCWKRHPAGQGKHRYGRRCPVCKKDLEGEEPVFARVFQRTGSTHVHVLGCRRCRAFTRG